MRRVEDRRRANALQNMLVASISLPDGQPIKAGYGTVVNG